ncbi:hypothetical protein FDB52_14910 [Clostridium botulinum]|nr:hypothetical protein [Clostridium botulinum]
MKKVDVVDLNNKQYRKLIKVQRDAYKKILNYCISNIEDIDKAINNELENIRIDNEKYIDM